MSIDKRKKKRGGKGITPFGTGTKNDAYGWLLDDTFMKKELLPHIKDKSTDRHSIFGGTSRAEVDTNKSILMEYLKEKGLKKAKVSEVKDPIRDSTIFEIYLFGKKRGRPVLPTDERSDWSIEHREFDTGKYVRKTKKLDEDKIRAYIIENYDDMEYPEMAKNLKIDYDQLYYRANKLIKKGYIEEKPEKELFAEILRKEYLAWRKTLKSKDLKHLKEIDKEMDVLRKRRQVLDDKSMKIRSKHPYPFGYSSRLY